jgi:hypothetical protein
MSEEFYEARQIKRARRSKAEMNAVRDGLYSLAAEHQPLTIRQLFYRAVATGLIDKSQAVYNNTVVRLVGMMREEGRIPFDWIIDNTRWMRKPRTYSGLQSMLRYTQQTYRRSIWDEQDTYVEIWCESDSIAGILYDVTEEFDVPLMPTGGQPSKSFIWAGSENLAARHVPCFVYYFGDYDKAGMDISKRIETDLKRYLPSRVDFSFARVAINESQIDEYKLPTRPPKDKKSGFSETVELEAMTTQQLHTLCRDCIETHIDFDALERIRIAEEAERETLGHILESLQGGAE